MSQPAPPGPSSDPDASALSTSPSGPPSLGRLPFGMVFAGIFLLRLCLANQPGAHADAALWLGLVVSGVVVVARHAKTSLPSPAIRAPVFYAWAALSLASCLWSVDPAFSLRALAPTFGGVSAALVVLFLDEQERRWLWSAAALAGSLHVVTAATQLLWLWPDALARAAELQLSAEAVARLQTGRPLGLALSPDLFGALCLLGAASGAALWTTTKNTRARALSAFAVGLCIVGILLSRSVGTVAAFLAAAAVAALLWLSARRHRHTKLVLLGLSAGGLLALSWVLMTRGIDGMQHSLAERWHNWEAAGRMVLKHPLGVGHARFAAVYPEVRAPGSNVTRYAHSAWMQGVAEQGWLFLVVIFAFFGRAFIALRAVRHSTFAQQLLLATAAGWTLRTLLDYDLQIAQTATGFMVLWALGWPSPSRRGEKHDRDGNDDDDDDKNDTAVSDEERYTGRRLPHGLAQGVLLVSGAFAALALALTVQLNQQTHPSVSPEQLAQSALDAPCSSPLAVPAAQRLMYTPCTASSCGPREALLRRLLTASLACPRPAPAHLEMAAMDALAQGNQPQALALLARLAQVAPGRLQLHQLRRVVRQVFGDAAVSPSWAREETQWFAGPRGQQQLDAVHPSITQRQLFGRR